MKIFIKVKPSAKVEKVEKMPEKLLDEKEADFKVSVKEPAKDGRANEAVIKALTEYFGISKSDVKIVSGHALRQKIVEIKEI